MVCFTTLALISFSIGNVLCETSPPMSFPNGQYDSWLCDENTTLRFRLNEERIVGIRGLAYTEWHSSQYFEKAWAPVVQEKVTSDDLDRISSNCTQLANWLRYCLQDNNPLITMDDGILINITKITLEQCEPLANWSTSAIPIKGVVQMKAIQIGRSQMSLILPLCNSKFPPSRPPSNHRSVRVCRQKVIVTGPYRLIDRLFNTIVFVLVIFVSLVMGALLDTEELKKQIKNPSAIIVGFGTQYLLMPLLAFTITKVFRYPFVQAIGLFVVGCCPGGTNSNQWTVLLDGEIDLSAVLTFISTLSSFVMTPMWLLTLGRHFMKYLNGLIINYRSIVFQIKSIIIHLKVRIPFLLLARNLLLVILPYIAGITVTNFFPMIRRIVHNAVKPLLVILLLFFICVGTYVNLHLFKMLRWYHALTAPLLPWCGFCLGALVSFLSGLPPPKVRTIAIETGFQNIGIAMLIIQTNFPSPESEMASVIIIITGILSSVPLWLFCLIKFLRTKRAIITKNAKNEENVNEEQQETFIESTYCESK